MSIKRLLVPVDYSDCSQAALVVAAAFAEKFAASLDVVHVWDRPTYGLETVLVRQAAGEKRSLFEMIHDNAQQEMEKFVGASKIPASVPVTQRLLSGEPASKILEELKKREHDLVVVGTHGRGRLAQILLGSVAEKLVQLSPIPVLTVPSSSVKTSGRGRLEPGERSSRSISPRHA